MKARQEVTAVMACQYRGTSKMEKRVLLVQFVSTHGLQGLVRPVRVD